MILSTKKSFNAPASGSWDRRSCLKFALSGPLVATVSACGSGEEAANTADLQQQSALAMPSNAMPTPVAGAVDPLRRTALTASSTAATTASNTNPSALGNPKVPPNPLRNYVFGPVMPIFATGGANVGMGEMSLRNLTTGFGNTALGDQVLWQLQGGFNCTGVGHLALFGALDAVDCTAIGTGALQTMTTGVGATAVGRLAAASLRTAQNTTAIGDSALRYAVSGEANTSVGYRAHEGNSSGDHNLCLGALSGLLLDKGSRNVLAGFSAMSQTASDASENVAVGAYALDTCDGDANVAVGVAAGRLIKSGTGNVFIGPNAGASEFQLKDARNSIAIGAGTFTTEHNQAVIGNAETETVVLAGVPFTRDQLTKLQSLLGS